MGLVSETLRAELASAYQAPDRHYHDLRHIEALLGLAHQHRAALNDHEAVEAAIWFHDAVYDPRRGDNEEESARLALAQLAGLATIDRIERIATMIRATAGHVLPRFADAAGETDCALFLDMDLAILGSAPEEFAAYERDVRGEYAFLPDAAWISGRRRVLADFLSRPAIYLTATFRDRYESRARQNLARAVAELEKG
jgi:predicted metal-dependent HD superfamily phosphohydrolase